MASFESPVKLDPSNPKKKTKQLMGQRKISYPKGSVCVLQTVENNNKLNKLFTTKVTESETLVDLKCISFIIK
jgi:hypothetical protein